MFKKKYPALSFAENFLGGFITIGPITFYGENAMHWAFQCKMGNGYLCCRLPFRCFKQWWPLYCYWSPDGTPRGASNSGKWFWGRKANGE